MASQITVGGTDVAGLWSTYIIRQAVPGLKAKLFFPDYCEPALVPRGAGGFVARWLVPTMRIGSTTALTEGSSGSAANMITITSVEGTVADYGEWFNIGDLSKETEITEALDIYRDQVEYAGSGAINRRLYTAAVSSTNFLHAGDTATAGVTLVAGNILTAQDFPVIAGFFHNANAEGFNRLGGDYMLAIHPNQEVQLVTDVTNTRLSWSEVNKHVPMGFEDLVNNHRFVGRLGGVTALRTTLVGTVTEDVAAYRAVALARYGVGWFGIAEKGPKMPRIIMKSPGPTSTNDPLDTNHTLGWKARMAERLLDANRALVVYSVV